MKGTEEERFWAKVQKTETCWIWLATKSRGYGHFWPKPDCRVLAHRWSYTMAKGEIPAGLDLQGRRRCASVEPKDPYPPIARTVTHSTRPTR